jgi:hypothetical protein
MVGSIYEGHFQPCSGSRSRSTTGKAECRESIRNPPTPVDLPGIAQEVIRSDRHMPSHGT